VCCRIEGGNKIRGTAFPGEKACQKIDRIRRGVLESKKGEKRPGSCFRGGIRERRLRRPRMRKTNNCSRIREERIILKKKKMKTPWPDLGWR